MAKFTLTQEVSISAVVDGEQYDAQVGPGVVELPESVGELLSAQGVASRVTSKKSTAPSGSAEE
ncbi:MAG: hypothetical protein KGL39_23025 [Patescibacteria group bacterium]|nr:hypothetical protein [Patescibacteria group bacterium]